MNYLGSSEYVTVFTLFTRATFLNMRVDRSSSLPKSTILEPFCLPIAFAKCDTSPLFKCLVLFFKYLDLLKTDFFFFALAFVMFVILGLSILSLIWCRSGCEKRLHTILCYILSLILRVRRDCGRKSFTTFSCFR